MPSLDHQFEQYMRRVNKHLVSLCGLSSDDLADAPYWDYFEDGMTPRDAAETALVEWNDWDLE